MIASSLKRVTEIDDRAALEDIVHLTRKICLMWGTPELDTFLSRLITDGRDGDRRGLPAKVAAEVLFLTQTNKMVRAIDLAKKLDIRVEDAYRLVDGSDQACLQTDALDDPLVSRDTITRGNRSVELPERYSAKLPKGRSAKPGAGSQAQGLGELLMMLVRSKWLALVIILVLAVRFVWPTVRALI